MSEGIDLSIRELAGNGLRWKSNDKAITGATSGSVATGLTEIKSAWACPESGSSAASAVVQCRISGENLILTASGVTGAVSYKWNAIGIL